MADHNIQDFNSIPGEATSVDQREAWQAPAYSVFLVVDAEIGANSNTDADTTAS